MNTWEEIHVLASEVQVGDLLYVGYSWSEVRSNTVWAPLERMAEWPWRISGPQAIIAHRFQSTFGANEVVRVLRRIVRKFPTPKEQS